MHCLGQCSFTAQVDEFEHSLCSVLGILQQCSTVCRDDPHYVGTEAGCVVCHCVTYCPHIHHNRQQVPTSHNISHITNNTELCSAGRLLAVTECWAGLQCSGCSLYSLSTQAACTVLHCTVQYTCALYTTQPIHRASTPLPLHCRMPQVSILKSMSVADSRSFLTEGG